MAVVGCQPGSGVLNQDGLSKLSKIFVPIAKCICPSFQMYLLRLRLLWLLPARFSRDDLPKGRFCGRHIVHRKRPTLIFCSTVHWVDCNGFTYWKEYPTIQGKRLHPGKQSIAVFSIICLRLQCFIFCLQIQFQRWKENKKGCGVLKFRSKLCRMFDSLLQFHELKSVNVSGWWVLVTKWIICDPRCIGGSSATGIYVNHNFKSQETLKNYLSVRSYLHKSHNSHNSVKQWLRIVSTISVQKKQLTYIIQAAHVTHATHATSKQMQNYCMTERTHVQRRPYCLGQTEQCGDGGWRGDPNKGCV